MRDDHLVLVISAAPSAILLPMSHSSWMCGWSISRKYHQMLALRGTTFGWSPPLVITECERCDRRKCSRRYCQPTLISSTASSADRPRHGAPALCAVSPSKLYSTDTSPVPPPSPHDTPRLLATCANSTTSTSL